MDKPIKVSKETGDRMLERLENPRKPSEKLLEAARRYKERVKEE